MKSIVLGGTSGIGRAISKRLKKYCKTIATGRKEVDTSSIESVERFILKNQRPNILILNTGGPPDEDFGKITDEMWLENFNKLFLSFAKIIKEINVKENGYIFLISSYIIKQPGTELILSSSIRSGFSTLFKSLSKLYSKKKISFINIAPGPIKTRRLLSLIKKDKITLSQFEKKIPGNKIPDPDEIALFVEFIIKNKIKSLNGVTIPFDCGLSEYL